MESVRDIILSPVEQAQIVELTIEGKKRKFYIGNVKEYSIFFLSKPKAKKIKLNLIEM